MATPIIKIENLSKIYRLGQIGTGTLRDDYKRWIYKMRGKEDPFLKIGESNDRNKKGKSDYIYALKDINLEVMPGEILGIIGKNGAGKSSLLKILSKVTGPTRGSISYNGRIGSLLEVGTGFHPELTGRENVFLNGAILGMTKIEIKSKFDEIVNFSGVERFIDTPVKRYSSGMMVRLGFAVAAHLEPEILVVDEVLAVGDAEFQKKAIGKMQDVSKNEGRTVLFVSHNMDSIQRLCNRGMVLQNGKIQYDGEIEKAIQTYQDIYYDIQQFEWQSARNELYNEERIYFTKFMLINGKNVLNKEVNDNDAIDVLIEYETNFISNDITIGFSLFDEGGHYIYRSLHTDIDPSINFSQKKGINTLKARLNTNILKSGNYRLILDASYHNSAWVSNPFEETKRILSFTKDQSASFSAMQISAANMNPIITWEIIN